MDDKKPGLDDLQRAFSVSHLEPEISEETLTAYAAGRATALESELVETMMEVDPSFGDLIETIREELSSVNDPLPVSPRVIREAKKAGWLPSWLGLAGPIVALGACGLLAITYIDRSHLISDQQSKNRQVAIAFDERNHKIETLQRQMDAIGQELERAKSDKGRLSAQLSQYKQMLDRELDARSKMISSPNGIESLVARALTKGLSIPTSIAGIAVSRGTADFDATLNPNRTSVRMPVKLSWSGPKSGVFRVEISQDGLPIWNSRVDKSEAAPPIDLLKPGVVYMWRVASGEKRSNWAGFRTCSAREASKASQLDKDRTLGPLEKGVAYADLGLVSEAQAQFKLLRASSPALADRLERQLELARK